MGVKTRTWTPEILDAPVTLPTTPHHLVILDSGITLVRVEKLKYENNNNLYKLLPKPLRYLVNTTDGIISVIAFT